MPKKKVTKSTAPKKTASKSAPVKKASPKSSPVKKTAAKKPTPKKTVASKSVAKKAAVKKPVAKKAPAKAAPKKAIKKAAPVKAIAKKIPAKPVAKNSAPSKTNLKIVPQAKAPVKQELKKPLASLSQTEVKTPTAKTSVSRITPIKAPVVVAAKPKTFTTKSDMTSITLPPTYEPTDKEEFMSPLMKEYFRQRLIAWRDELIRESEGTLHVLQEEGNMQKPDITDRASEETDLAIEFRTRDRERKLLNKINEAMLRIEDSSYGYCEETGDPIPVKRLIARPTATRTLEAEELHERRERTQRDQYE